MPAVLEATGMRRVRSEFGEAVTRVLQEHGLSLRAARIRTGIDHVTLSDMASGYVPRMERVVGFARAFGLPINDWLALAGYERIEEMPHDAGARVQLELSNLPLSEEEERELEGMELSVELLGYNGSPPVMSENDRNLMKRYILWAARHRREAREGSDQE